MPPSGYSTPLAPYVDPESKLLVQALDPADASSLVERLPCLVHLLPHFRQAALNKFSKGGESDVYLSGCCPSGEGTQGERTGLVLYSIEKGRRGAVNLVCRLLCIDDLSNVSAGRALLIPAAIMHKAQRIEAKINSRDEEQKAFWLGLGFEIRDDIAEMPFDASAMGRRVRPAIPAQGSATQRSVSNGANAAAAQGSTGGAGGTGISGKKRGRPPAGPTIKQRSVPSSTAAAPAPSREYDDDDDATGASVGAGDGGGHEFGGASSQPADPPLAPSEFGDFASIEAEIDENDLDIADPATEVYIRTTCPGASEPHMVLMSAGVMPPEPSYWHLVPEQELWGRTIQCVQCRSTFCVNRDTAERQSAFFQDHMLG